MESSGTTTPHPSAKDKKRQTGPETSARTTIQEKRIFYEEHDMAYQIEHTYRSSIMIGIHGSGLSHVAWMRPNTTMIEILPYKFNCRDWYERTCNVSGVNYFKYIPLDKEESPNPSYEAIKCWNASNGCEGYCLDALRDQNIKANKTVLIIVIGLRINSKNLFFKTTPTSLRIAIQVYLSIFKIF